jgi:hypothetical protein
MVAMATPPNNPFNRRLADGVRRHGFRKWYERELLSSHAHLLLTVLCCIGLMGSLELFSGGTLAEKLVDVAMVLASAGIGLWALRRYLYLLNHAEAVANQADCPACGAYARFDVVGEDPRSSQVRVRCRQCSRAWTIEE